MTLQSVTVKLPRTVYQRLERLAATTNQSLDTVLLQTIRGNLPPSLEDVPADFRDEVALLLKLNDDDLWAVARSSLDSKQWRKHRQLLEKNTAGDLKERDQHELDRLRLEADRFVLRKSFALALLKWRGYTLPTTNAEGSRAP